MREEIQLPDLNIARHRSKAATIINREGLRIDERISMIGMNKKYFIRIYGCQANLRDGETLAGIAEAMHYTRTEEMDEADLILINTCAIRENAQEKVFGELGSLKRLKRNNPNLIIAIGGCMIQQPIVIEDIKKTYPQVDIVFGLHVINELPLMIDRCLRTHKQLINVPSKEGAVLENLPACREHTYKAWVSIMDGCDNFCTYCIVPYTRGKQRSRDSIDILKEIDQLISMGYMEVTLLGQNVNSYGLDLSNGDSFAKLLESIAQRNIARIRFMTSNPWDFSDDIIEVIGKYDNIMPFIHLPVQSGSDRILKLMGRRYTFDSYIELFNKIKKVKPNAAFSTDIIVGFPSETEEDFQRTLDLFNICKFDSAFTFAYSIRPGTPGEKLKPQIDDEVKKSRLDRLNELVVKYAKENKDKYMNKVVEVLCDGPSRKNSEIYSGYTDTFKLVNFVRKDAEKGKIVKVKITGVKSWTLDGEEI